MKTFPISINSPELFRDGGFVAIQGQTLKIHAVDVVGGFLFVRRAYWFDLVTFEIRQSVARFLRTLANAIDN